jgi:hypothetical protein
MLRSKPLFRFQAPVYCGPGLAEFVAEKLG